MQLADVFTAPNSHSRRASLPRFADAGPIRSQIMRSLPCQTSAGRGVISAAASRNLPITSLCLSGGDAHQAGIRDLVGVYHPGTPEYPERPADANELRTGIPFSSQQGISCALLYFSLAGAKRKFTHRLRCWGGISDVIAAFTDGVLFFNQYPHSRPCSLRTNRIAYADNQMASVWISCQRYLDQSLRG